MCMWERSLTQVDVRQHLVEELRLCAVRGEEVGQQLAVAQLGVSQQVLETIHMQETWRLEMFIKKTVLAQL